MTEDLKMVVIAGAAGRMGRALIKTIHNTTGMKVHAALEREGSPAIGQDAGELAGLGPNGILITDDALPVFAKAEGVLDFTAPAASLEFADLAAQARIVHVIGTTGMDESHEARLQAASRHARIVKSGNMSLGVNLLSVLVRKAARALDAGDWDIEVLEMHHRHKVDAPSGTALMLGKAAAEGRSVDLTKVSARGRDGHTGERRRGDIGFASLRGGTNVGEHTVMFAADGEVVELTHRATDRGIFARGAVKAALWGRGKAPGLYSMMDVLGIEPATGKG
jgi:4-hydroxy-tetrahydrodipicolinate reductase